MDTYLQEFVSDMNAAIVGNRAVGVNSSNEDAHRIQLRVAGQIETQIHRRIYLQPHHMQLSAQLTVPFHHLLCNANADLWMAQK